MLRFVAWTTRFLQSYAKINSVLRITLCNILLLLHALRWFEFYFLCCNLLIIDGTQTLTKRDKFRRSNTTNIARFRTCTFLHSMHHLKQSTLPLFALSNLYKSMNDGKMASQCSISVAMHVCMCLLSSIAFIGLPISAWLRKIFGPMTMAKLTHPILLS